MLTSHNENDIVPTLLMTTMERRSAMKTAMSSSLSIVAAFTAASPAFGVTQEEVASFTITTAPTPTSITNTNTLPTATKIPSWTLPGNVRMPVMALNTAGLTLVETERALTLSVKNGITHVDFHPGRERDGVAKFLERQDVTRVGPPRSELFLTTKINMASKGTSPADAKDMVRDQIEEDLSILNVKFVDMLMLRDHPDAKVLQSQWSALEDALAKGQTRSIGVINFCQFSLTSVLATAKVTPAVNYYLTHVGMGLDPRGLRSFGEAKGIRTFAYGALGEPGPNKELLQNPIVNKIAKEHGVSPEAVAVRWILQSGAAVSVRPTVEFGLGSATCLPKTEENKNKNTRSKCDQGLAERAASFQWELTTAEMSELSGLTSPNDNPTLFSSAGCPDAFGPKDYMKYIQSLGS